MYQEIIETVFPKKRSDIKSVLDSAENNLCIIAAVYLFFKIKKYGDLNTYRIYSFGMSSSTVIQNARAECEFYTVSEETRKKWDNDINALKRLFSNSCKPNDTSVSDWLQSLAIVDYIMRYVIPSKILQEDTIDIANYIWNNVRSKWPFSPDLLLKSISVIQYFELVVNPET